MPTSDFSTIRFERRERVATITLNRPERKNAMNQAMKDDLRAAWTEIREDSEIWAAIITGAGDAFSSGADVESLDSKGFRKADRFRELAMIENIRSLPTPRRMNVFKPVISAVNGMCIGVMLDMVTESDIPIASEQAQFFDSHVSIGYVSSHEMVNMVRRVPPAVAMRIIGGSPGVRTGRGCCIVRGRRPLGARGFGDERAAPFRSVKRAAPRWRPVP